MRRELLLAAAAALALSACGSSKDDTTPPATGFPQPAGTVAVNFTINDSANQVFTAGQLQWKGSMAYNATTRMITADSTWTGPWATLYDDGPWTTGGHEPVGATAGDHIWGVTVFVTPPATGSTNFEYGAIDTLYEASFGNGWIWTGNNGTFSVAAGATAAINASPLTLPAFGTIDMQLTIDTHHLDASSVWDTSVVKVKSSAWGWSNVTLADDGTKGDAAAGDGIYTFRLSEWAGTGKPYAHTGLLLAGATPEFVFTFGTGNGVEYKDAGSVVLATGVTAGTKPPGGSGYARTAISLAANNNTRITVPTWTPFTQPAGTVAVNFSVNDSANKVFTDGQLQWKGSMAFNAATRIVTPDSTWTGPWATLYDDGPWSVGGHEPANATAGDSIWGVTVFVTPPATGSTNFEYGVIDTLYETSFGNGWIWTGGNGTFAVAAGATAAINATGLTLAAFGTNDMRLTIDTNALGTGTWDTSLVRVKGSAWGWSNITLVDDGTKGDVTASDGIYTLVLSEWVGAGKPYAHTGLLLSGAAPEFIFTFGTGTGLEYKDASNVALATGVTAATRAGVTGTFTGQTISIAANNNTYITVP